MEFKKQLVKDIENVKVSWKYKSECENRQRLGKLLTENYKDNIPNGLGSI